MPAATNRQLAVRLAVSRALGRTRDLDDVYNAALDTLAESVGISRAAVLLFGSDGVMRFQAYRGLSSDYRAAVQGHSPWTPDSVDPEPILVPDVGRDPSLHDFLPVFERDDISALAFIPMVSLGRVIGKFMLYYDTPHAFDDEEIQLATVIAAAVAFAVERGRNADVAWRKEASQGSDPNAAVIGPWEWEVATGAGGDARKDGLPSGTLRQVRQCNIDRSTDCMKVLDLDGRLVYINAAGLERLGVEDADDLLGRPLIDLWPEKDRQDLWDAITLARSGATGRFQGPCRTPAGVMRWWDMVITPIADRRGVITQLLSVSRDVSATWQAEAFRAGQQQVLEMIATGAPLDQVLTLLVHVVEDQCEGMECAVLFADTDGTPGQIGGPARQQPCWSTPILSPSKKVLGSFAMYCGTDREASREELRVMEIAADLAGAAIDHHRSLDALRRSEERNRAILRAIPDWMFVLSKDGIFLDCHVKNVEDLLAPPEAFLGKSIYDVLPPWLADAHMRLFDRAMCSNEAETLEYSLELRDERRYYEACIVRHDSDKFLSIVRDTTDRKRAELDAAAQRQELAHLNRVLMLAEQSGALAHELSQPLAAILSNAQAARRLLDEDRPDIDELRATLDDVIRNDKRAGAVIQRLRELLKKSSTVLQPLDVNEVAREVLDLIHSDLLMRRVRVTTSLPPTVPTVLGDRVQLQQVILNLVINACDAMSTVDPADRENSLTTKSVDGFAEIAVTDRGAGIPDGKLDSVFEPFVTYRPQGLGLGLTISRSIVVAHRGRIKAENNPDRGATFRCFLPAASGV